MVTVRESNITSSTFHKCARLPTTENTSKWERTFPSCTYSTLFCSNRF